MNLEPLDPKKRGVMHGLVPAGLYRKQTQGSVVLIKDQ
jgi:hypothetical protein